MKDENKQEDIIRINITLGKTIFAEFGTGKDHSILTLLRKLSDKDTEIIAKIEFEEDGKDH